MYLVVYNLLCFGAGFLLVASGFFISGQKQQLYDVYGSTFPMALLILITVAIALTAMASDGAFYQSGASIGGCQTLILILAMLILLSLEISGFLVGFVMNSQVEKAARENFLDHMRQFADAGSNRSDISDIDAAVQWIDITQRTMLCCGIDSPNDWLAFLPLPPASCCQGLPLLSATEPDATSKAPAADSSCGRNATQLHQRGCTEAIHEWLTGELRVYSVCCLTAAALQICGLGLALVKQHRRRLYPAASAAAASSGGRGRLPLLPEEKEAVFEP